MDKRKWSFAIKFITTLTAWTALALQLYILIDNTPANGMTPLQAVGRFFIFFTVLSNLLVAISLTIILISHRSAAGKFFAKPSIAGAITFYIAIVGLVYNVILRNLWHPTGRQQVADELLHVGVPLLQTIYWLIFVPKGKLRWGHPIYWLAFPGLYLCYALIRGAFESFYPYPFINVIELGYGRVLGNCVGLLIIFIIIGFLFVATDRMIDRQSKLR